MAGGQQINVGQGALSARTTTRPEIKVEQGILTPLGNNVEVALAGVETLMAQQSISQAPPELSGQSIGSATGTLPPSTTRALSAPAIAVTQGLITASQESEDAFIESRQGSPNVVMARALSGVAMAAAQGNVGFAQGQLTGHAAGFSIGTFPALSITRAITGLEIAVASGTVQASGSQQPNDGSAELSGMAIATGSGAVGAFGGVPAEGGTVVLQVAPVTRITRVDNVTVITEDSE